MATSILKAASRIFVFLDMIISSTALLAMLLVTIFETIKILSSVYERKIIHQDGALEVCKLWILVVLASILVSVDMWASIMFLKVTKQPAFHFGASTRARDCRNVNLAFILLCSLYLFVTSYYYAVASVIIFRIILVLILVLFKGKLNQEITKNNCVPMQTVRPSFTDNVTKASPRHVSRESFTDCIPMQTFRPDNFPKPSPRHAVEDTFTDYAPKTTSRPTFTEPAPKASPRHVYEGTSENMPKPMARQLAEGPPSDIVNKQTTRSRTKQ